VKNPRGHNSGGVTSQPQSLAEVCKDSTGEPLFKDGENQPIKLIGKLRYGKPHPDQFQQLRDWLREFDRKRRSSKKSDTPGSTIETQSLSLFQFHNMEGDFACHLSTSAALQSPKATNLATATAIVTATASPALSEDGTVPLPPTTPHVSDSVVGVKRQRPRDLMVEHLLDNNLWKSAVKRLHEHKQPTGSLEELEARLEPARWQVLEVSRYFTTSGNGTSNVCAADSSSATLDNAMQKENVKYRSTPSCVDHHVDSKGCKEWWQGVKRAVRQQVRAQCARNGNGIACTKSPAIEAIAKTVEICDSFFQ